MSVAEQKIDSNNNFEIHNSPDLNINNNETKINSQINFNYILIFSIFVVVIIAIIEILINCLGNNDDKNGFNNSIIAYYLIEEGDSDTLLFHSSYLKFIDNIKINDIERNIGSTVNFIPGKNKVEITFKNKLSSLEDLFLNCFSLNEINLFNLSSNEVTSTANMFRGCKNLENIMFDNFETNKINNISYMFSGCSKLTSIDLNAFKYDKIIDIQGLFDGCSGLRKINFGNFNTINVINMSKLFSGCNSLTEINFPSDTFFETREVIDMSYTLF